jgi:DDB1- and CUL4-associated factor 11
MWMFSCVTIHDHRRSSSSISMAHSVHAHQDMHSMSKVSYSPSLLLEYLTVHPGVVDGRLVLRHRRPLTQPYPNVYSHPLPRFRYQGGTGRIAAEFENDPEFAGGTNWRAKTFYLAALPRPRPRTLLDNATDVLSSALRSPLTLFGGPPVPAHDPVAAGTDDAFNLRQEEVDEQDRGEDAEDDDDPARDRAVRVIGLTPEGHNELSSKAWVRRQWAVLPLRNTAARYSAPS